MPKRKDPPKRPAPADLERIAQEADGIPPPEPTNRRDPGTPIAEIVRHAQAEYPATRNIPGKSEFDPTKRITLPKLEQFARLIVEGSTNADAIRACYPNAGKWASQTIDKRGREARRLTQARINHLLKTEAESTDITPAMIEAHLWKLAQAGRASYVDKWGSQRLVDGGTSARAAETLARIKGLVSDGKFQLAADSINISMDFGAGAAPAVDVQAAESSPKAATGLESGPILPVVDAKPENGEA